MRYRANYLVYPGVKVRWEVAIPGCTSGPSFGWVHSTSVYAFLKKSNQYEQILRLQFMPTIGSKVGGGMARTLQHRAEVLVS